MTKHDFLNGIHARITQLPTQDIERSLDFYSEMIDDRIEEGMTEEQAVAAMGSLDEIATQILLDTPLPRLVKAKIRPTRSLRTGEIVLLILGSPVWVPLLLAGAVTMLALILSLYAVLWSLVLTLYAVELTFAIAALALLPFAILMICQGHPLHGIFVFGTMLVMVGLSVATLYVCRYSTLGALWVGKQIVRGIKSIIIRKERKA